MKNRTIAIGLALLLVLSFTTALASPCAFCGGDGKVTCSWCNGRGGKYTAYDSVWSSCSFCGGTGKERCSSCRGTGQIGEYGSSDSGSSGGGASTRPTPTPAPKKAAISDTSLSLVAGRSATLTVSNASRTVKWSSSDRSVATVSSRGKVTAKKAGSCTITARVGSQRLKCKVRVTKKVYARSLKLNAAKAALLPGGTLELGYSVSPDPSKITEAWSVSFSSDDRSVAAVDKSGVVKAKKVGSTAITATLKIGKGQTKKVRCKVRVETGLARFKRWFKANRTREGGNWVVSAGDGLKIVRDASAGTWTFLRHEHSYYNGDIESRITFDDDFTGTARLSYYWISDYGISIDIEGDAVCAVRSISSDGGFDWRYSSADQDEFGCADSNMRSMLSSMQVLLKFDAKLDAKGGWKDLGLKAY